MTIEERNRALADKQRHRDEEIVAILAAFSVSIHEIRLSAEGRAESWIGMGVGALSAAHFLRFVQAHASAIFTSGQFHEAAQSIATHQADSADDIEEQARLLEVTPGLVSTDLVLTLQAISMARLLRTATNTSQAVAENVTLGLLADDTQEAITDAVTHTLNQFETVSRIVAENSLYSADRAIAYQAFHDVVKHYLFFGPRDERNRPFCAVHAGHTFTKEQIDQWDTGATPPYTNPWLYGAGIGCRHTLIGVAS